MSDIYFLPGGFSVLPRPGRSAAFLDYAVKHKQGKTDYDQADELCKHAPFFPSLGFGGFRLIFIFSCQVQFLLRLFSCENDKNLGASLLY